VLAIGSRILLGGWEPCGPEFDYELFPTNGEFLLRITMTILCKCDIKLTVEKLAEVKGTRRKIAKTISYSYNASSPVMLPHQKGISSDMTMHTLTKGIQVRITGMYLTGLAMK